MAQQGSPSAHKLTGKKRMRLVSLSDDVDAPKSKKQRLIDRSNHNNNRSNHHHAMQQKYINTMKQIISRQTVLKLQSTTFKIKCFPPNKQNDRNNNNKQPNRSQIAIHHIQNKMLPAQQTKRQKQQQQTTK
eukprot:562690_1